MMRLIAVGLGMALFLSSGCGTVRGLRTASVSTPCLTADVYNFPEHSEELDYSPTPHRIIPPASAKPTPALDEVIPPPPPESLEVSSYNRYPARKPILPPLHQASVRMGESVLAKLR